MGKCICFYAVTLLLDKERKESIVIDLTASVGGVTLPLAKICLKSSSSGD